MSRPTFTLATVTYNAAQVLAPTLQSVRRQSFHDFEHLIIDGASRDGSLDMLQAYQAETTDYAVRLASEPDKGLYDAMNKAIHYARGCYILFLNAGDTLHSDDTLLRLSALAHQNAAVIYGDTLIMDSDGHVIGPRQKRPPMTLTWRSFKWGMTVCHQAFLVQTDLAKITPYDLTYKFSADFDWCIRLMRQAETEHLPLINSHEVVAHFLEGGLTTQKHNQSLRERFRIMTKHYGWPLTLWQHLLFALHVKSPGAKPSAGV